jgi:hypothetical protein
MAADANRRHISGILGLLCREHFLGLVDYVGRREPAYTFPHYYSAPDVPDRDGRVFANKAEHVMEELWVSLPRTGIAQYIASLDILDIMTIYIASICRISTDDNRDMRRRREMWLKKPVRHSCITCTMRRASRLS